MSPQIAVRLSEDVLVFLDQQVTAGVAASRADAVRRAVERERRRVVAESDAVIYAALQHERDPDGLDDLAEQAGAIAFDDID
jgi:Arc/MetJ-type ribon-helix-helix transcriptional regulator